MNEPQNQPQYKSPRTIVTPGGILAAFLLLVMAAGCQGVPPIEPTLALLATETPTPGIAQTAAPRTTIIFLPSATLPATWTVVPGKTIGPPPTTLPTETPPAATATLDSTAQAPLAVTSNGQGATNITLTEAQLNAALAKAFDAAPLTDYYGAPRVSLADGSLTVTLHIVPNKAPSGTSPKTILLTASLAIVDGALEVQPTHLEPLDVGVLTTQVKPGQALLLQTLQAMVLQAAGSPPAVTYNSANVSKVGISLMVVAAQ